MKVITIGNIGQFRELREVWNTIYAKDPDANAFDSWAWLCGWLESTPRKWLVLGVQPNDSLQFAQTNQGQGVPAKITIESSPYVSFMVFSERKKESKNILSMGGYPHADHAGFVCLPEYVDEAIPALAVFIREQLQWDTLRLPQVYDPRLDLFLRHLSSRRITIEEGEGTSCPYISLPDTWEQYFNTYLGSSTRKGLKNDLNKIRRLEGFHVTETQTGDMESHIDTLLKLWQTRWELKSDDLYMGLKLEDVLNIKRSFLRSCFEENRLWLTILWDGKTPIAAGAVFLDPARKNFCILKIAANYDYAQYSPGNIWCLHAIRYAIEKGYKICDFGRGTEKYKFSLGCKERFNRNVVVVRMGPLKKTLMRLKSRLHIRARIKRLTGFFGTPAGSRV